MWDCLRGLQFPSRYLSLLWPGLLPGLQCEYLLHRGPPWAVEPQPASLWSSLQAAGESLLQDLEHVLPLSWCLKGCFSHIFSLLSHRCYSGFYSFSNMCSQRHHQLNWPAADTTWRWLELVSPQRATLATKTLSCKIKIDLKLVNMEKLSGLYFPQHTHVSFFCSFMEDKRGLHVDICSNMVPPRATVESLLWHL